MDGRCERCPAPPQMWFWRVYDRHEWQLCKHHGEQHEAALRDQGFIIGRDERPLLVSPLH